MPITQDRFLTVILGAKRILEREERARDILNAEWETDVTNANSVLAHSPDSTARDTIRQLLNRLTVLREAICFVPYETRQLAAIILAEELHFRRVAERNRRSAQYRQYQRQQQGMVPRGTPPALAMPKTVTLAPSSEALPEDFENTPEFKRFQAELRRTFGEAPPAAPTSPADAGVGLPPSDSDAAAGVPTSIAPPDSGASPEVWITGKDGTRRLVTVDALSPGPISTSDKLL